MLGTSGLVLFALFGAGMAAILVLVVRALRAVVTRGKAAPVSAAQFQALADGAPADERTGRSPPASTWTCGSPTSAPGSMSCAARCSGS